MKPTLFRSSPEKYIKAICLSILVLLCLSIEVNAGVVEITKSRDTLNVGDTIRVSSGDTNSLGRYLSNPRTLLRRYTDFVSLNVWPDLRGQFLPDSFAVDVVYQLIWYDTLNVKHVESDLDTIRINYGILPNKKYTSQAVNKFPNAYRFKIGIVDVIYHYAYPGEVLLLKLKISEESYYKMDSTQATPVCVYDSIAHIYNFNWGNVTGAEDYDFEWTFVSNLNLDSTDHLDTLRADSLEYSFRFNASRVTIPGVQYALSDVFESGYLLYRVRPVGRWGTDFKQRREGKWSSLLQDGKVSNFPHRIRIRKGHKDSLSWQYTSVFAEEGKRKEAVSYFDGSMRNRQSVTKLNHDPFTIVGETIYDYQGRGTIQVLPSPTFRSFITYNDSFNVNAAHVPYNKRNFDTSTVPRVPDMMSTFSGASNYYSTDNPLRKEPMYAYLPEAGGYPFVQTEFMPDNTGRIRRQAGAGDHHFMGSGKETEYYYGMPTQAELDRLFGTQVGFNVHYKKNMVRDPNGQFSVSYLDLHGHVIASALAGNSSDSLKQLDENIGASVIKENLLHNDQARINEEHLLQSTSEFLVSTPDTVRFQYNMDPFLVNARSCKNFCFSGFFNLNLRLENTNGKTLVDTTFRHISVPSGTCTALPFSYGFKKYLTSGAYTVTKKLSLDEDSLDAMVARMMKACPNKNDSFYTVALLNVDTSGCHCYMPHASWGGLDSGMAQGAWSGKSFCQQAEMEMLADMGPGGQYWKRITKRNWKAPSSPYLDQYGNPDRVQWKGISYVPDSLPSLFAFESLWKASWAASLLEYNPEKCRLGLCDSLEASYHYDDTLRAIQTYNEAVSRGLFVNSHSIALRDPFWKSGSYFSSTIINASIDYCINTSGATFSMKEVATVLACCPTATTDAAYASCLTGHGFGYGTDALKDKEWQLYRAFYLSRKQKYVDSIYTLFGQNRGCADSLIKTHRIANVDSMLKKIGQPGAQHGNASQLGTIGDNMRNSYCHSKAWADTTKWKEDLAACGFLRDTTIRNIIRGFAQVSELACRLNISDDYFGADSLPAGQSTAITHYTSFKSVLMRQLGASYPDSLCNTYTFSFPKQPNHNYFSFKGGADPAGSYEIDSCVKNYFWNACYRHFRLDSAWKSTPVITSTSCFASDRAAYFTALLTRVNNQATNHLHTGHYKVDDLYEWQFLVDTITASDDVFLTGLMDSLGYHGTLEGHSTFEITRVGAGPPVNFNLQIDHFDFWNFQTVPGDAHSMIVDVIFLNGDTFTVKITSDKFIFTNCVGYSYKPPGPPNFTDYFNYIYNTDFTDQQIFILSRIINCNDTFTLRWRHIAIPWKMMCEDSARLFPCFECAELDTQTKRFDHIWENVIGAHRKDTTTYYVALENFLNAYFNSNLTWLDYQEFKEQCVQADIDHVYGLERCYESVIPQFGVDSLPCKQNLLRKTQDYADNLAAQRRDSMERYYRSLLLSQILHGPKEEFNMRYPGHEYHFTLYYYDQAGNLVKTVPPAGVVFLDSSYSRRIDSIRRGLRGGEVLPQHKLPSQYRYNSLNQAFWQKTPDGGVSRTWYDGLGRAALSQNARQRSFADFPRYTYTAFNSLNRISFTCEIGDSVPVNDSIVFNRIPAFSTWRGYRRIETQIKMMFYDTATFLVPESQFIAGMQNLRNRLSSVIYKDTASPNYSFATHYSYDRHGNVKELVQENTVLHSMRQGFKRMVYDFDLLSGKTNSVVYQPGKPDRLIHKYSYDEDNRLQWVETSTDSVIWDRDAKYFYYRHGPLWREEIGQEQVQGLDYAYTIQGWIKGVNANTMQPYDRTIQAWHDQGKDGMPGLNETFARDVFGYTLGYYSGDYKGIGDTAQFEARYKGSVIDVAPNLFNGNIRSLVTAVGGLNPNILAGLFQYDQLNRLIEAKYLSGSGGYLNQSLNAWVANNPVNYNPGEMVEKFEYDPNGNILKASRYKEAFNPYYTAINHFTMDSLHYEYYNGTNRLRRVRDSVPYYDKDIHNQTDEFNYSYDSSGSLIADSSEEIAKIEWNSDGKIWRIFRTAGSYKADLEYAYDPMGNRAMKLVKPRPNGKPSTPALWEYTWYVRDAQGNTMATYTGSKDVHYTLDSSITLVGLDSLLRKSVFWDDYRSFIAENFSSNTVLRIILKDSLLSSALAYAILARYPTFWFAQHDATFGALVDASIGDPLRITPFFTPVYKKFTVNLAWNRFAPTELLTNILDGDCSMNLQQYSTGFIDTLFNTVVGAPPGLSKLDQISILCGNTHSFVANAMMMQDSASVHRVILNGASGVEMALTNCSFYSQFMDSMHSKFFYWTEQFAAHSSPFYSVYGTYTVDDLLSIVQREDPWNFMYYGIEIDSEFISKTIGLSYVGPYDSTQYRHMIENYFGKSAMDKMFMALPGGHAEFKDNLNLSYWDLYGSKRLGILEPNKWIYSISGRMDKLAGKPTMYYTSVRDSLPMQDTFYCQERGKKQYYISNHLSNLMVSVTDRKLPLDSDYDQVIDGYRAEVVNAAQYFSYGNKMEAQSWDNPKKAKRGMNGQERDYELNENTYTAEFWEYDSRLGSGGRWNMDPVVNPGESPYSVFNCNPIFKIDHKGNSANNYDIYEDGKINEEINEDKTNTYTFHNNDGTTTDLGTYTKLDNGLIDIGNSGKGWQQVYDKDRHFLYGNGAAGFLGATYSYFKSTGYVTKVNQFMTQYGQHSKPAILSASCIDVQYVGIAGFSGQAETSDGNVDYDKSNALANNFRIFGYNALGAGNILSENSDKSGAALDNSKYWTGHQNHFHVQGFNDAQISFLQAPKVSNSSPSFNYPILKQAPPEKWSDGLRYNKAPIVRDFGEIMRALGF